MFNGVILTICRLTTMLSSSGTGLEKMPATLSKVHTPLLDRPKHPDPHHSRVTHTYPMLKRGIGVR